MTGGKVRYLHRVIMEELLGRPLRRSEVVHHRDHNPRNNSPANLLLQTHAQHTRLHHGLPGKYPLVNECAACGRVFVRPTWGIRYARAACSASCAARLRRRAAPRRRTSTQPQAPAQRHSSP